MKVFLWFCAVVFILFIFLEWGVKFTQTKKLTPIERGIIGRVNKTPISYRTFVDLTENYRRKGLNKSDSRRNAFNSLIEEALINEEINKSKINLTDDDVLYFIKTNPPPALLQDTFLQTDGKFDMSKYHALISNPQNLTWLRSYEAIIRNNFPRQLIFNTVINSVRPVMPDIQKFLTKQSALKIEYAKIEPDTLEYIKFYEKNKNKFKQYNQPVINYVKFDVPLTEEDKIEAKNLATEIYEAAKLGISIDSLSTLYNCPVLESKGKELTILEEEDGFHIIKENKEILVIFVPSEEKFAIIEDKAKNFIEEAKNLSFEAAASSYNLKINKIYGLPKDVDLSYIDVNTPYKIIGPVEGDNCFYVLQTLGIQTERIPEFSEIKDTVINEYMNEYAKKLKTTGFVGKKTDWIKIDSSPEGEEFFIKCVDIPKDSVKIIEVGGDFYVVRCIEKKEPTQEEAKTLLTKFYEEWLKEEAEKIYKDWVNNLKQKAKIEDYRYTIY